MITRTLKKTGNKIKDDFFNENQREELKKILISRFIKLKGEKGEKQITKIVNDFLMKNKINGKTILELE